MSDSFGECARHSRPCSVLLTSTQPPLTARTDSCSVDDCQMCLATCFASSHSAHGRPCPRLLRWSVREHLECIAEAAESQSTRSAPTHRKPVHVDGGGGSHDNSLCLGAPAIATAPTIVSRRFSDTLHQLSADQSQTCACRRRRWQPRRLSLSRRTCHSNCTDHRVSAVPGHSPPAQHLRIANLCIADGGGGGRDNSL